MQKYIKFLSLITILSFCSFTHAGESMVPNGQIHLASTVANITYQGEYVANGGCCTTEKVHYQSVRYKHHHHKKYHKHQHKQHKKHHRKHYKKRTSSCGCA